MHVHANSASQGTEAIELFGDHPDEFRRHLLDQNHAESVNSLPTVTPFSRPIATPAERIDLST